MKTVSFCWLMFFENHFDFVIDQIFILDCLKLLFYFQVVSNLMRKFWDPKSNSFLRHKNRLKSRYKKIIHSSLEFHKFICWSDGFFASLRTDWIMKRRNYSFSSVKSNTTYSSEYPQDSTFQSSAKLTTESSALLTRWNSWFRRVQELGNMGRYLQVDFSLFTALEISTSNDKFPRGM